ncbi:MAG TPA: YicC family protein [Ruminococcaceae bacterium]|nr:YicC family protein [Oscillospiraceae bacterium]
MTGYGRAEGSHSGMDVTMEIKSVNHRYFEFSARMPRIYSFLEDKIKAFLQGSISRGKVDVYLNIDIVESESGAVKVNASLAKDYFDALERIARECGVANNVTAHDLARYPDVLSLRREIEDEQAVWQAVEPVLREACESLVDMRLTEGERLKKDIDDRMRTILAHVDYVEERSPQTVLEYRAKLEERMRELLENVQFDEQRLLAETAIFADKIAVSEETVRLRSHIGQMRTMLEAEEPVGRKLDFLVQEMNREANTIGSKAQDAELAGRVVDIKSEIEKIREQVQNIE